MLAYIVASVLISQPLDYQVKSFETEVGEDGVQTGQLAPSELACLASSITNYYTGENAVDVLWVDYIRQYTDRSKICVRWAVERSESLEQFMQRKSEPEGVWFDPDLETVHYRDVLSPVCVPRGQTVGITACLSSYLNVPGRTTHLSARRQRTTDPMVLRFAWERFTGGPSQYALDRRMGLARSHLLEIPPDDEDGDEP